eukprot:gene3067-13086_t
MEVMDWIMVSWREQEKGSRIHCTSFRTSGHLDSGTNRFNRPGGQRGEAERVQVSSYSSNESHAIDRASSDSH